MHARIYVYIYISVYLNIYDLTMKFAMKVDQYVTLSWIISLIIPHRRPRHYPPGADSWVGYNCGIAAAAAADVACQ